MGAMKCAACGRDRHEHSYNGACFGICGKFVEPTAQQSRPVTAGSDADLPTFQEVRGILPLPPAAAGREDDPSRAELIESIQYAIGMISMHIEAYHDFDYPPHQVPQELEELRRLQHHLEGSLIDSKGGPAVTPQVRGRSQAEVIEEWRAARQDVFDNTTKISEENTERWTRLSNAEHALMSMARALCALAPKGAA